MVGRKQVARKRRQLVVSVGPLEFEQIQADLEALGIEERYRSEFLRQAIMDAIAVLKEGKIQIALNGETILELNRVVNKQARRLYKAKAKDEGE